MFAMGKQRDLIQILIIVVIGMFIPFLVSIRISFGLDIAKIDNLLKIGSTFGYFLIIFGMEIVILFLYFTIRNKIANKKLNEYKLK